jgi:hypothetical protein
MLFKYYYLNSLPLLQTFYLLSASVVFILTQPFLQLFNLFLFEEFFNSWQTAVNNS